MIVGCPILVEATYETDLRRPFADDYARCKKSIRVKPDSALDFVLGPDNQNFVLVRRRPCDEQLASGQFPKNNGRVRCHEDLKRRIVLLRAQRSKKPDNPVWLEAMLQFINQDDAGMRSCFPLKAGDEQPRRTNAESTQRYAIFIVQ